MRYSLVALAASSTLWGAFAHHGHHHHHHHHHHNQNQNQNYKRQQECIPPMVPVPCTTIVTSYLVPIQSSPVVPTITTTTLSHDGEINEYVCVPEPTTSTPVVPGSELVGLGKLDDTPRQTLDQTVYIVPSLSKPPVEPSNPHETPRQTLDQTVYIVPSHSTTPVDPSETPRQTLDQTVYMVPLPEPSSSHSIPPEPVATSVVTTTTTAVQEHPSTPPNGQFQPPWAITYSPFKDVTSVCRTKEEIEADIDAIAGKGIKTIRLYGPDCSVLEFAVPVCKKHGIQIILGIFARDNGSCEADDDLKLILKWAQWDQVILFVVGNEALLKGQCTADVMAKYVTNVKGQLRNSGYQGLVTIAEPLSSFENKNDASVLCDALDVFAIHCHPFFNSKIAAADSGQFLNDQVGIAEKLCGDKKKDVYVLEAGWPSAGSNNGIAIASIDDQKKAFTSFQEKCQSSKDRIVYFTYRDDDWKQPGPLGVETHFGCGQLF